MQHQSSDLCSTSARQPLQIVVVKYGALVDLLVYRIGHKVVGHIHLHSVYTGYLVDVIPYVLSYRVLQDEVQIIAILHTARDRAQTLTIRTDIPTTDQ